MTKRALSTIFALVALKKLIAAYLKEAILMQVATAKGSQPWACSVYFAYDRDFNLYWISKATTRHSKEIMGNKKVAGTIVLPHKFGDDMRGLSFQGTAKELKGKEAIVGMARYAKRFAMKKPRVDKILKGLDGHYCYKITPKMFVLFDEVNFPDDPRQEYKVAQS